MIKKSLVQILPTAFILSLAAFVSLVYGNDNCVDISRNTDVLKGIYYVYLLSKYPPTDLTYVKELPK